MRPEPHNCKLQMAGTAPFDRPYVGRFAPSPTGDLHFGSMIAAVGSYLQARKSGGVWRVRIEDLDPPREVPGAAERQLHTLARFGLVPDGAVERQSQLQTRYQRVLKGLLERGDAFPCACTRADLPASGIYPGTCRRGMPADHPARSIRFRVSDNDMVFHDGVQGMQRHNPARQCGDFVIRRADGLVAYQLAVVVDDGVAGVSEVVRGADLIDSTARQIQLQRALALPQPAYAHLPLIVDSRGRKLSKSQGDDPIDRLPAADTLRLVLRALGHEPPRGVKSLDAVWRWAAGSWNLGQIPRGPISIAVQGGVDGDYTQLHDAAQQI